MAKRKSYKKLYETESTRAGILERKLNEALNVLDVLAEFGRPVAERLASSEPEPCIRVAPIPSGTYAKGQELDLPAVETLRAGYRVTRPEYEALRLWLRKESRFVSDDGSLLSYSTAMMNGFPVVWA